MPEKAPSSALGNLIPVLETSALSKEAIREIERLLDVLRANGWSGYIPADEALRALVLRLQDAVDLERRLKVAARKDADGVRAEVQRNLDSGRTT